METEMKGTTQRQDWWLLVPTIMDLYEEERLVLAVFAERARRRDIWRSIQIEGTAILARVQEISGAQTATKCRIALGSLPRRDLLHVEREGVYTLTPSAVQLLQSSKLTWQRVEKPN